MEIYTLRIFLDQIQPPIWRRVRVPEHHTLGHLHRVVQVVMGWQDYHLHEFSYGSERYGRPDYDEGAGLRDERRIELRGLGMTPGSVLGYLYDFGDDWHHIVVFEGAMPASADETYPLCIGGERSAPPEDVGGIFGYQEFLQAIADPEHERHEELISWSGGGFDPELFSIEKTNRRLRRAFPQRRPPRG